VRWRLLVLAAAAAVLAVPTVAAAVVRQDDGNDTRGLLDVRRVVFEDEARPLRWTITTFQGWTVDKLWDHGNFVIELDVRGDEAVDERIVVRSDGQKLRGALMVVKANGDEVERELVPVTSPNHRTASIAIAFRKLRVGAARTSYLWAATTLYTADPCPRTCVDRAPDEGSVEQPFGRTGPR
jgi:hypothetical protein